MKKMIILVGNIGSGKSTVCKKLTDNGYRILSRDSLRYMVGAGKYTFDPILEPTIKTSFLTLIAEFCKAGENLVIDETNMNKKIRSDYIGIAKENGYLIECLLLPKLSKEESVNRRMNNPHDTPDRKVWEMVWDRFNSIYEEPSRDEGLDAVNQWENN